LQQPQAQMAQQELHQFFLAQFIHGRKIVERVRLTLAQVFALLAQHNFILPLFRVVNHAKSSF
jgi:hypothetical protein